MTTSPSDRQDGWEQELPLRAAAGLLRRGLRRGDRVVLLAASCPELLAVSAGALRAGIVPVPLHTSLPAPAIAELVADADPALVVVDEEHRGIAPSDRDAADLVQLLREGRRVATRDLSAWPQARPMHYTSGTTGRSKGVWSGVLGTESGRALCEEERATWGFVPDDVHLVCAPLSHSGPHRFALNSLVYGARVIVLPRFDPAAVLEAIAVERVTSTFCVPAHLVRLLDHPSAATADLTSLRLLAHAGAPCPEPLKRRVLARFPPGSVWEFYGSTEGQFTVIGPQEWLARPGSVGRARPGRVLSVRDEHGEALPPGAVGTIWCRPPAHARFSYWRDPAKTAAAWQGDRFTVGDVGSLDEDDYLTLAGRRSDLILTGGVNVYPAEIERVLLAHPGVAEAVVFGVPDRDWGERVCAALTPRAGARVDPDGLRQWLRERLAGYQVPKTVLVVDDLPRTPSGKVARARVAEALGLRLAGAPDSI